MAKVEPATASDDLLVRLAAAEALAAQATQAVEALRQQVGPDAKEEAPENAEEEAPENADSVEGMDNLYCFAVHELLWPRSVMAAVTAIIAVSTLLWSQVLLSYGFHDSEWLLLVLGIFPQYTDNIQTAAFYPTEARVGVGKDVIQTNVVATVISLCLLSVIMKRDNEPTLLAAHPIDAVLHQAKMIDLARR